MERVRQKLLSQRGASITFALLLFLVCAIISSVVIVAGTAASGRMSQIAEMDQRYYAVTSAAELLKDTLDGKGITVKKTTETSRKLDQDGELVPDSEKTSPATVAVFDDQGNEVSFAEVSELSLLAHAAYSIATDSEDKDWPYPRELSLVTSLSSSGDATQKAAGQGLEVTVVERLESNGILTLYVTKKTAKADQAYTLKLTFKADVTKNDYVSTDRGTPKDIQTEGGVTTYTVDETRTEREVTTLKWTLTDIVKSSAPGSV